MAKENAKEKIVTSKTTGLDSNVAGALAYSLGIVSGLLFIVVEKDDKFVRFHAMQSIVGNLAVMIIPSILLITIIGVVLVPVFWIVAFIYWIVLIYKAYQGEMYKIPYIGDLAEKVL